MISLVNLTDWGEHPVTRFVTRFQPSCKFGYSSAAGKSQFKLDFVVSLDQWQNLSEVSREALVRP
jgi:hypothetical protein